MEIFKFESFNNLNSVTNHYVKQEISKFNIKGFKMYLRYCKLQIIAKLLLMPPKRCNFEYCLNNNYGKNVNWFIRNFQIKKAIGFHKWLTIKSFKFFKMQLCTITNHNYNRRIINRINVT